MRYEAMMKAAMAIVLAGLALAFSNGVMTIPATAAPAEEDLQETIDYLLDYVRTSDVIFIRNNKEHTPEEAADHIFKKYKHYKKKIKTPEDFIRLAATKSMMSGKAYQIRTADGVTMTTAEWLTKALEEYRSNRTRAPGISTVAPRESTGAPGTSAGAAGTPAAAPAEAGPEINPGSPDSSRYEIRVFERKSGECKDPYRNCVSVRVTYPEILGTPIVGAEETVTPFIMMAALRSPMDTLYHDNLGELADAFIGDYEALKEDMPDYQTGWFLERSIDILYNGPRILSLAVSDFTFTGGAHPNSNTEYVSLDLATGDRLGLPDLLVEGYETRLTKIAEAEFRRQKQITPDEGLTEAGYWFEDGKFRLNDNFAVTDEGLVFYFNNYEIASYADGPTRLVLTMDDLEPLLRKDRLEWLTRGR